MKIPKISVSKTQQVDTKPTKAQVKAALKHTLIAKTHKAVKANAVALSTTNPLTPAEAVLEALGILAYLVFLEIAANESGKPVPKGEIAKLLKQLQALLPSIKGKFSKMAKYLQSMITTTKTKGLAGLELAFYFMLKPGSEFNIWMKANLNSLNGLNMISPELGFYISMLMISALAGSQQSPNPYASFFEQANSAKIAQLLAIYIYQLPPPQGGQAGLTAFLKEISTVGGPPLSYLVTDLQNDAKAITKAGGIPSSWHPKLIAGDVANDWDAWVSKHYGE